ncbi:hypothetical protein Btru_077832 [Bulinus truncatus]|nr:hypothetical protein Btru_077832 [Bulinus truncatus]
MRCVCGGGGGDMVAIQESFVTFGYPDVNTGTVGTSSSVTRGKKKKKDPETQPRQRVWYTAGKSTAGIMLGRFVFGFVAGVFVGVIADQHYNIPEVPTTWSRDTTGPNKDRKTQAEDIQEIKDVIEKLKALEKRHRRTTPPQE